MENKSLKYSQIVTKVKCTLKNEKMSYLQMFEFPKMKIMKFNKKLWADQL